MTRKLIPCPDYAEFRRLAADQPRPMRIAAHFGVSYKLVLRWLRECGIEYRKKPVKSRGAVPEFGRILRSAITGKRVTARLYWVWGCMKKRCTCPTFRDYKFYGSRGITFAPEWADYAAFRAWAVSHGYRKGLTLDRIDNDGPYSPENCRWTTMAEQNRNKARHRILEFRGEKLSVAAWARRLGISYGLLASRVQTGWAAERALTEPRQTKFRNTKARAMKSDTKYQTCCGQRKRYRVVDGKLVEQPHECRDAKDVAGMDWTKLKGEQLAQEQR